MWKCLNKHFKDTMCEEWNDWMLNGEKSCTKDGAMHSDLLHMLFDFVIKS